MEGHMPKSTQFGQKKAAITTTLSLRLLRPDKKVEQAIRDTSAVVEVESDSGRLFTAQAPGTPPQLAQDRKPVRQTGGPKTREQELRSGLISRYSVR